MDFGRLNASGPDCYDGLGSLLEQLLYCAAEWSRSGGNVDEQCNLPVEAGLGYGVALNGRQMKS